MTGEARPSDPSLFKIDFPAEVLATEQSGANLSKLLITVLEVVILGSKLNLRLVHAGTLFLSARPAHLKNGVLACQAHDGVILPMECFIPSAL